MNQQIEAQSASYRVPTGAEIEVFCKVLSCAAAAGVLYYRPKGREKLILVRTVHLSIITTGFVVVPVDWVAGIVLPDFAVTAETFLAFTSGKEMHAFIPEWLGGAL